jgi:predicted Zn-dependent peptidase
MKKEVLANGITVIYEKTNTRSVVVQVMVKTGSNQEDANERGLSHFLEHLLFEGTTNRPNNKEISEEIEKIGGDINAYTSNERTSFYVKVLAKHYCIAVEILADILQNPLFRNEDIKREKNVVLKEIDMVLDEPRFYQWVMLQKNLFKKHPCRFPTYGKKENIKKLTRENIVDFFYKYYIPNNMIISVVGNIKDWKKELNKHFIAKKSKLPIYKYPKEPKDKKVTVVKEKKNISSTYMVMGFKTVSKNNNDAYPLEIINTIMGRGQSSRMFTEIRTKLGLAYDVGSSHIAEVSYGYFAIYACVDKKKVNKTKEVILKEIEGLKNISDKELKEAKTAIEGEFYLDIEDPQKRADQLLFWEQAKDAHELDNFISNINKVKISDVKRVIEKYFHNYTFAVLEGK